MSPSAILGGTPTRNSSLMAPYPWFTLRDYAVATLERAVGRYRSVLRLRCGTIEIRPLADEDRDITVFHEPRIEQRNLHAPRNLGFRGSDLFVQPIDCYPVPCPIRDVLPAPE